MVVRFVILALVASQVALAEQELRAGLIALSEARLDDARVSLEAATQVVADAPFAWVALAQTYRRMGRGDDAARAVAMAGKLGSDVPAALLGLASYYAHSEEWLQAGHWQRHYAETQPHDAEATLLAIEYLLRGGDKAGAAEFARTTPARGESAEIERQAGMALAAAGMRNEAGMALRKAVELSPYDEGLRWDLTYFHLQAQEFTEALEVIEEARAVFDKSARLELGKGIALYGQRRFAEAVDAFLYACELAPAEPRPHAFLGRLLRHAGGRMGDVIARYEAFSQANPQSPLGPFLTANALLTEMGARLDERAERAAALLQKSIAMNGGYWESRLAYGKLLSLQGKYEQAAAELESAVKLAPKAAEAHYHLARVYARLGRSADAERERKIHAEITEAERQSMSSGESAGPPLDADGPKQ